MSSQSGVITVFTLRRMRSNSIAVCPLSKHPVAFFITNTVAVVNLFNDSMVHWNYPTTCKGVEVANAKRRFFDLVRVRLGFLTEEVGQLFAKYHGKFACALPIGFIHALTSAK